MSENIELEGVLHGPEAEEKLKEIEKKLYIQMAAEVEKKLLYFMPFLRKDENDHNLYHYKFISVQVNTKELWEQLVKKLEELDLQESLNDVRNLAKGSAVASLEFDFLD